MIATIKRRVDGPPVATRKTSPAGRNERAVNEGPVKKTAPIVKPMTQESLFPVRKRFARLHERAAVIASQLWAYMAENSAPKEQDAELHIRAGLEALKNDVLEIVNTEKGKVTGVGGQFLLGRIAKKIDEEL